MILKIKYQKRRYDAVLNKLALLYPYIEVNINER